MTKYDPEFFVKAWAEENPKRAKRISQGKESCPFVDTYINGLTKHTRELSKSAEILRKELEKNA